jgi:tetratricopeptide (TPR) repeat protein
MKKLFVSFAFLLSIAATVLPQTCRQLAKEVKPVLSPETKKAYDLKLAEAFDQFTKAGGDENSVIWLGRRTAYLGNYKDAVRIYSEGLSRYTNDARLFRHRGHRYITIRCFDEAVRDLERAANLTKGKADEIEPDGLSNAKNIPTSTLQTNIYYHLGLAKYFKSDFDGAAAAFMQCYNLAKSADMQVAAANWLFMSEMRLGKTSEAKQSVGKIPDRLDMIENGDYYRLIKLYQGKIKPEDLLKDAGSNATIGYGLGNWYLSNGKRDDAIKIFRQITAGNEWASFGYIAAETELNGQKHDR